MKFATILAATAAVAIGGPAFATSFVNPGFENQTFPGTTSYYNIGPVADHPVPPGFGWTVSNGNVDIISYVTYGPAPANGGKYGLDLVGYGTTGEISQSIDTVLGKTYTVSFDYEANPGVSGPTAGVGFNGDSSIGVVTGTGSWQTFKGTFVGTGGSQIFSVNEIYGANNGGVFLDNFSIAAPEPAAWALMLVGFGGLGVALRRRRTLVAA